MAHPEGPQEPQAPIAAPHVPGPATGTGPISLALLGVMVMLAGIGLRWVEDVVAPWVNEGEVAMGEVVTFEADGGSYRIVSSGPARPGIVQTRCVIERADGTTERTSGHVETGAMRRLWVTRVLEFDTVPGTTTVHCGRRPERPPEPEPGRYQVVDADGLISMAGWGLIGSGLAIGVAGAGWWFLRSRRGATG